MTPYDVTNGLCIEYVIFRTQNRALGNTVLHQYWQWQFTFNENSWRRSLRYDVIHARGIPVIPKCCSSHSSSVWWSMVSNAADRSSMISTDTQPLSRESKISLFMEWNYSFHKGQWSSLLQIWLWLVNNSVLWNMVQYVQNDEVAKFCCRQIKLIYSMQISL